MQQLCGHVHVHCSKPAATKNNAIAMCTCFGSWIRIPRASQLCGAAAGYMADHILASCRRLRQASPSAPPAASRRTSRRTGPALELELAPHGVAGGRWDHQRRYHGLLGAAQAQLDETEACVRGQRFARGATGIAAGPLLSEIRWTGATSRPPLWPSDPSTCAADLATAQPVGPGAHRTTTSMKR